MPSSITIKLPDKLEKELEAVMKAEKTSKDKIIKDALRACGIIDSQITATFPHLIQ